MVYNRTRWQLKGWVTTDSMWMEQTETKVIYSLNHYIFWLNN